MKYRRPHSLLSVSIEARGFHPDFWRASGRRHGIDDLARCSETRTAAQRCLIPSRALNHSLMC